MIIFNKNKHFNKIIEDFFNDSMANIRGLNIALSPLGVKQYIEKNKEKFTATTFLYLLFLQDCALHRKYSPKYKKEVSAVLNAMLFEIANRFHYVPQKLSDLYLQLRQVLSDIAFDKAVEKIGLYYALAVSYLESAFSDEDYPEYKAAIYNDTAEYLVANFFQRVMNENMKYLFQE